MRLERNGVIIDKNQKHEKSATIVFNDKLDNEIVDDECYVVDNIIYEPVVIDTSFSIQLNPIVVFD